MDYLQRDSLHAGVPYGRHFDQQRLIGSLCLNAAGDGLAITDKGKTAAEMLIFARYIMFSEVYWHHAVRSATAMLQRAFYLLHASLDLDSLFRLTDGPMIERAPARPPAQSRRRFARTVCSARHAASTSGWPSTAFSKNVSSYDQLARRPYAWLAHCAEQFATVASTALGRRIAPHEILFDAPPLKREIEFHVDIYFPKEHRYRPLAEVSPIVQTLTTGPVRRLRQARPHLRRPQPGRRPPPPPQPHRPYLPIHRPHGLILA